MPRPVDKGDAPRPVDKGDAPPPPDKGGKVAKQLEKAVLSEDDVPKGYVAQDMPHIDEMFAAMVGGYRLNADPCATPPKYTGKPDGVPSATALFLNEKKSVVVVEMLAATGPEVASDMVTDTETVLDECPVTKSPGTELEMEALDWNPKLGDESITVGMRFDVKEPDLRMSMRGKVAFVAYRDLSLTVGLIGVKEPSDRDFKNVVRTAVRKAVLSTPVATERRM
ncbi:hypothetical protein [Actinoplanes couchii]|uniref:hypothetical protein n=1 Tax=Actinoplanes couchii TaxID=403638 RepID=UPI0019406A54|nr:hypothetical protein [Actinoplanes couchii]MDR6322258.1 hypothetical protein [Actinoplanes couchii]